MCNDRPGVTRKFHVLVVQNGIVVEKTNFEKKLGVRTQLPWCVDAHVKTTLNVSR